MDALLRLTKERNTAGGGAAALAVYWELVLRGHWALLCAEIVTRDETVG